MARPCTSLVLLTLAASALSACTTTYVVNGRRVDDSALQSIDAPPPGQQPGPARPSAPNRPGLEPPAAGMSPKVASAVPASRIRRFRRHGGDLVKAWRYGAVGDPRLQPYLDAAEDEATDAGRAVLQTGRAMVMRDRTILRGSCWTYANGVYERAGVGKRKSVFKTGKSGPYAHLDLLRPGDFLSYVNHSWHGSVHSAIFVGWVDKDEAEGLMLSYVGGRKAKPGGYRTYTLTHVYRVQRPAVDVQ